MGAALPRRLTEIGVGAGGRLIYTAIVRSMQFLEVLQTVLAPAGAARPGKAGFDKLTTESRNAHH